MLKLKPKSNVIILSHRPLLHRHFEGEAYKAACVNAVLAYMNWGNGCHIRGPEDLETMTEDELHELMQAWMNSSSDMRASTGMNKPPKQLRRQWRIGQLMRAKRQRRQKTQRLLNPTWTTC